MQCCTTNNNSGSYWLQYFLIEAETKMTYTKKSNYQWLNQVSSTVFIAFKEKPGNDKKSIHVWYFTPN